MNKLKDWSVDDQPREKLINFGAQNLSNSELLAIILRVGNKHENVMELSQKILKKHDISKLSKVSYAQISKFNGINKAKACQILACFELARRFACFNENNLIIKTPKDVFNLLHPYLKNNDQEHFIGLYLNKKNFIIRKEIISIGTLDASLVHPRDIFKHAITDGAYYIILAHNHPSGDSKPSKDDLRVFETIDNASKLLGLKILDHIIIGKDDYYSYRKDLR